MRRQRQPPTRERYQRKHGEYRRNDVPIAYGVRECRRQVWRHDSWDQKCEPDEAEAVHYEQRPQRFGAWPEAELRPDITSGGDPPRDEAECDAHEKPELWQDEFSPFRFPRMLVAVITALRERSLPAGGFHCRTGCYNGVACWARRRRQ
jgi:hypothetical protein